MKEAIILFFSEIYMIYFFNNKIYIIQNIDNELIIIKKHILAMQQELNK